MDNTQDQSVNSIGPSAQSVGSGSHTAITSLPNILQQAVVLGASDVHFEPNVAEVTLRYRIGVELRDMGALSASQYTTIDRATRQYAGISILSNQQTEGHFDLEIGDKKITVNVQIMPSVSGDIIVLSLQTAGQLDSPLVRLGMSSDEQAIVEDFLTRDRGLLLVIGPPKSGKTTTLYSILSDIDLKQTPVSTLELDVKSKLVGVSQNKVNSEHGGGMAESLKVLIEQNKRTIMLSQISDGATARLAMDATTGGHQIVAGMFSNSIGEAINFFQGFKIEPFKIASNLLVIVNQRLLRLLCPFCKQPYTPDDAEISFLRQNFDLEKAVQNSSQIDAFASYDQPGEASVATIAQLAPEPASTDDPDPYYPSADPAHTVSQRGIDRMVIPAPSASTLLGHSILEQITADPTMLDRGLNQPAPDQAGVPASTQAEPVSPPTGLVAEPTEPTVASTVEPAELASIAEFKAQDETVNDTTTPPKAPPINYIIKHLQLFHANGCDNCHGTGYIGVGAIFEVMQMNEKIGEAVLAHADSIKLQQVAEASGMTSLRMSAINKILQGDTSVDEVSRILSLISRGVGILT